jgi:hypothetical protein
MTLAIAVLTSSGIVITADSRQTYWNKKGAPRIGSDSAMKLFKLTDSCGVAISGRAFLSEDKQPPKDAGSFIDRFAKSEKLDGMATKDIAERLNKYLAGIFVARETEALKKRIEQEVTKTGDGDLKFVASKDHTVPYTFKDKGGAVVSKTGAIETIHMIVAGIDADKIGRAYSVFVPKGINTEKNTDQCGAIWVGQTDVLVRIVKGHAPEIGNIAFVKDALAKDEQGIKDQLNQIEYIINWGAITVQDAMDFCVLMTRTTESIQRFSDGTILSPGGITGVGGQIDIAVLTPEHGFQWLKKKQLMVEGTEFHLGAFK